MTPEPIDEAEFKEESTKNKSHLPTTTWDKFHTRPGDSGMHPDKVTAKTGRIQRTSGDSD